MAKRKNNNNFLKLLAEERYLIWAILFTVVVGVGLLTQISIAKMQMDAEISSSLYLVSVKHKSLK